MIVSIMGYTDTVMHQGDLLGTLGSVVSNTDTGSPGASYPYQSGCLAVTLQPQHLSPCGATSTCSIII